MKKTIRISRYVQLLLLVSFFLPFFPKSCAPSAQELEANAIADSTHYADSVKKANPGANIDSILNIKDTVSYRHEDKISGKNTTSGLDSSAISNIAVKNDSTKPKKESESDDNSLSEKLSKKSKLLKAILRPGSSITGIGYVLDLFQLYLCGFGIITAFLLWIISLIIKYKDFNNILLLINTLALILILFTDPVVFLMGSNGLYGYWICVTLGMLLIIYDTIIIIKIKKNRNTTNSL